MVGCSQHGESVESVFQKAAFGLLASFHRGLSATH